MSEVERTFDKEMELSIPQSEFYLSESKYTAAVAGFGSGKTEVALLRMHKNFMEAVECDSPGEISQAYLAPTYPLIRDIWYPKVEDFFDSLKINYTIKQDKHNVIIPGLGKILCRTMEKPERIIGWEAADGFLDEFDVLATNKAMQVLRKITARLREKNPTGRKNQLFFTTTPEGFKATYNLFKKDPLPDSKLIQMSTYSNLKNLPEGYIESLVAQYPAQLIEAYLRGKFVNLQAGTVYYTFDRHIHKNDMVHKKREPILVGMDFNVNDMCASVWVKRGGMLNAVDEFCGLRDTPDVCDALNEEYPGCHITVFPDASGGGTSSKSASESDLSILKDSGFNVSALKKNPLIKNRVAAVNKSFEIGRISINTDRCSEITLAFEQQAYDEKTGQPEKDGYLDNRVDGAGYLLNFLHPVAHRQFRASSLGSF
ncbi:MAG: terminase [Planctomycetes bacterium]|nr:terminase [Planctomycetota bacterium]